jgi:hypothetical protein
LLKVHVTEVTEAAEACGVERRERDKKRVNCGRGVKGDTKSAAEE